MMNNATRQRLSFFLILFFLVNLGTIVLTADATAQATADRRFGAIESFWAPPDAAALGAGWERILFYWSEIQPGGPNDWNTLHVLEEWLHDANAHGRTVVGLLKNTPGWATDGQPFSGVPRGLYLPVDDPGNLWANYVRRVATYYGPLGVHNWIVWNEPEIPAGVYGHEFSGSVEDYYQLTKVAYQAIKQVDPNAAIHLAGWSYWHDQSFLRRFLQVAAADPEAAANNYFFDVISLHIYFRSETVPTIVGSVWATQSEFGLSKPVWINETNASSNMDPLWPVSRPQFQVDLEQQAWYIVQAYALGFHAGAARIAVYKLIDVNIAPGDESWGILRPDFSRRPAYDAYATTIKYLSGFTYPIQRQREASHYIVSFNRPVGVTRVIWARTASPVTVRLPALAPSALLVEATGQTTTIAAENGVYTINLAGARCYGECIIGGPPLFLVEEGVSATSVPTAAPAVVGAEATPVPSATATLTATLTLTPTTTPTPSATATPSPTATATQTPEATATATTSPTIVASAVATVTPTVTITAPARTEEAAVAGLIPAGQASWWFLGAGGGLALLLAGLAWRRSKGGD